MQLINNILNKEQSNLSFKERQLIIDYFRHLVNKEFNNFKKSLLNKGKNEIFEKAYLIESYDNIRIRLLDLSFFVIVKLLKYCDNNFIDLMYNLDVTDGIFDYYDDIEKNILNEISKLNYENNKKIA